MRTIRLKDTEEPQVQVEFDRGKYFLALDMPEGQLRLVNKEDVYAYERMREKRNGREIAVCLGVLILMCFAVAVLAALGIIK